MHRANRTCNSQVKSMTCFKEQPPRNLGTQSIQSKEFTRHYFVKWWPACATQDNIYQLVIWMLKRWWMFPGISWIHIQDASPSSSSLLQARKSALDRRIRDRVLLPSSLLPNQLPARGLHSSRMGLGGRRWGVGSICSLWAWGRWAWSTFVLMQNPAASTPPWSRQSGRGEWLWNEGLVLRNPWTLQRVKGWHLSSSLRGDRLLLFCFQPGEATWEMPDC